MPSILFVCTANQFRSPLAAAFLREYIRNEAPLGDWTVESAGTWAVAGRPAAAATLEIAARLRLRDLESHRTRPVSRELLDQFDLILVMETGQREGIASEFPNVARRVKLLGEVVDGVPYSVADATGGGRGPDQVAAELRGLIQGGGKKILRLAASLHGRKQSRQENDS